MRYDIIPLKTVYPHLKVISIQIRCSVSSVLNEACCYNGAIEIMKYYYYNIIISSSSININIIIIIVVVVLVVVTNTIAALHSAFNGRFPMYGPLWVFTPLHTESHSRLK